MTKTRKEIAEQAINKYLNEPIKNITQAYYDEFVKENAKSSAQVGIKTIVIRREIGRCCDWCHSLVGEYEYGEQPAEFFRRHDYCKCIVLFQSSKNKYIDVWSKKEFETEKSARIEKLRQLEKEDTISRITRETLKPYWDKATPGKGQIRVEDGVNISSHRNEMTYAKVLHQKFGGNIVIQLEDNKVRKPDYLWNGKLWEHKTIDSKTSVDNQTRAALGQVEKNPGGVIIQKTSDKCSLETIKECVFHRLNRETSRKYNIEKLDFIVFEKEKIVMAFTWKK